MLDTTTTISSLTATAQKCIWGVIRPGVSIFLINSKLTFSWVQDFHTSFWILSINSSYSCLAFFLFASSFLAKCRLVYFWMITAESSCFVHFIALTLKKTNCFSENVINQVMLIVLLCISLTWRRAIWNDNDNMFMVFHAVTCNN